MNVTAFYFGDIMIQDEIKSLEGEEWKDIKGFEGEYAISSYGRLASYCKGKWNLRKLNNRKNDYFRVVLISKERKKSISIHRLVAETFIPNPNGLRYVHHKDGNKQNNAVSNLVWMSSKDHHKLHMKENPHLLDGMNNYNKYIKPKKIYQFSRDGKYIRCFSNAKEASNITGVCHRNITQTASRKIDSSGYRYYTAGGYIWSHEKEIDLEKWYDKNSL